MSETIGTMIKRYRRERGFTQEELAEYLNVSPQAVSGWERSVSIPDVGLLVPLANTLGVTLDELFDRPTNEDSEVKEFIFEGNDLHAARKFDECLAFWREKAAQYPRNFEVMRQFAGALMTEIWRGEGSSDHLNECAKEALAICHRILRSCNDNGIRSGAIYYLVHLYGNEKLCCRNEAKALEYAKTASSCYSCREVLEETVYDHFADTHKKERDRSRHNNILTFLDFISNRIVNGEYDSDEDYIKAQKAALTLWETVIDDGNFLFYHTRVGEIHDNLAHRYAKMGDRENALRHIEKAVKHADAYDNASSEIGEHCYTGTLIRAATASFWGADAKIAPGIRRDLHDDHAFDFMRGEEFEALFEE